jgi:hypothetical protein
LLPYSSGPEGTLRPFLHFRQNIIKFIVQLNYDPQITQVAQIWKICKIKGVRCRCSGRKKIEPWKDRALEPQNLRALEPQNLRTSEPQNLRALEDWSLRASESQSFSKGQNQKNCKNLSTLEKHKTIGIQSVKICVICGLDDENKKVCLD